MKKIILICLIIFGNFMMSQSNSLSECIVNCNIEKKIDSISYCKDNQKSIKCGIESAKTIIECLENCETDNGEEIKNLWDVFTNGDENAVKEVSEKFKLEMEKVKSKTKSD